jgi:hypothetical protein
VDYESEVPRLFDMRAGEQKNDPWLEAALTNFRTRAKTDATLRVAKLWLTDDLAHLVVIPVAGSLNREGIPAKFEDAGSQFSADDFGLDYARPDPKSHVITTRLGMNDRFHARAEGLFIIQGKPHLLHGANGIVKLSTFDGETRFQTPICAAITNHVKLSKFRNPNISDSDFEKLVNRFYFNGCFYQPDKERLVFVDYHHQELTPYKFTPYFKINNVRESLDVIVWYYLEGRVEYQRVNLKEIFKSIFGQYRPSKAEALPN